MKIVYMGTPDFAVPPLAALVKAGYEITAVVTQPDKPKGRGKTLMPTPVKEEAMKHEIPVYQPVKVRDPEFVETLTGLAPDIIVVAAFGQIIPKTILDLPKYGCINIHASLLPKYRGAAPIQQAVIDGEKESGVTIMRMGTGLDTGDMISKIVVPIETEETGGSLFDKLAQAGADLLMETLPSIENGTATYEKQPEESPTPYAAMITKKMGLMDFSKSAEELERLVRGLNPWPSAYTFLNGKTLKVWKSTVEKGANGGKTTPGTITAVDKTGIHVACGEDVLVLREVQLEGKKRMETDAFLRGYQVTEGTMLTDHYDPRTKTVNLSQDIYGQTSLAAVGVAAHECGHAIQHATNYAPLEMRSAIVPAANIGSSLSWPLFLIGLFAGIRPLVTAGIVLFSLAVLFQLVTLPVEVNASARALKMLQSTGILGADETKGARKVLTAAAMTYVAALAASILQLLRLVILAGGRRDD